MTSNIQDLTVVGFYEDSRQTYVGWVTNLSPASAIIDAVSRGICVVAVFDGNISPVDDILYIHDNNSSQSNR